MFDVAAVVFLLVGDLSVYVFVNDDNHDVPTCLHMHTDASTRLIPPAHLHAHAKGSND